MQTQLRTSRNEIVTFIIVTIGSILYCSKGVVAKLAYAEGLDPVSVLNLRMLIAFPFFAAIGIFTMRRLPLLALSDWAWLIALGFLGYYLTALVNFTGLQYVSAGLERIILYTYPTLVLILGAVVLNNRAGRMIWIAAGVSWLGVLIAFGGEVQVTVLDWNLAFGVALIFTSALLFAIFIMLSGATIQRVGSVRFAAISMGASCVFISIHFLVEHPVSDLHGYSFSAYGYGIILALFGTVAPSILMCVGIQRAGPERFAIMGTFGPVMTLFLAWAVLQERPTLFHGIGLALALAGGLTATLVRTEGVPDVPPTGSTMPTRRSGS